MKTSEIHGFAKRIVTILTISTAIFFHSESLLSKPMVAEAKICVTVVGETGKPIDGVSVTGYFSDGRAAQRKEVNVSTDSDGRADLIGKSYDFGVATEACKDGYYKSSISRYYMTHGRDYREGHKKVDGRWLPYGLPETLVLKKQISPVVMVKFPETELRLPELGMAYGYDLEYGSLVEPFGKGKTTDFLITIFPKGEDSKSQMSALLTFPNELDGAQLAKLNLESDFPSPYRFDEESEILHEVSLKYPEEPKKQPIFPNDSCILLRTRTQKDNEGRLVAAHYGKIYGPIRVFAPRCIRFSGITFFNPTENSNNLESLYEVNYEIGKGRRRQIEGR